MKKNNKTKIISLIVLVVGVAAVAFFVSKQRKVPTVTEIQNSQTVSDDIVVDTPTNGQVLTSGTLNVSGKARGSWYFQGNAPFEIEDSNKNVIETSAITAQGDSTTTDFVPFTGEITFTVPSGVKSGFVMFSNDNSSGDPSGDESVSIPITFK